MIKKFFSVDAIILILLIQLMVLVPVTSDISQQDWKEGDIYTWDSITIITDITDSFKKQIDNSTFCKNEVTSVRVDSNNITSKFIYFSHNDGGVQLQGGYNYSSEVVTSSLAQMFLPLFTKTEDNETVIFGFNPSATPPYMSEFDSLEFKHHLELYWTNLQAIIVFVWNGSQNIPYTLEQFVSMADSIKIMGNTNLTAGINLINSMTRQFSFEFDLTSSFRLPSKNYANFNISVDKKIYKYEFGITPDGFRDFIRITDILVKNGNDGYGINHNYLYYQKFMSQNTILSCDGQIITKDNQLIIFVIGFAMGIICSVIIVVSKNYYHKKNLEEK